MRQELLTWESAGNRHVGLHRRPFQARHSVIADVVATELPQGGSVLDIGCGLGQTLELIQRSRPDARLTFADPYQECLDQTARFVDGIALRVDEHALELDAYANSFDAVVASHVLEHALDPVGLANEIMRLCRPGGLVVLVVPNVARPKVLWYGLVRRHYANRGHVVAWDPSHWRLFVENAVGQRDVRYVGDEVQIFPAWLVTRLTLLSGVERRLAKMVPWWSFSNVAVIRRGAPDESDDARPRPG